MKWYEDVISKIIWPYDLRKFYNTNKPSVLTNSVLYEILMGRSLELQGHYETDSFRKEIVDNFIFDLEADKEDLDGRLRTSTLDDDIRDDSIEPLPDGELDNMTSEFNAFIDGTKNRIPDNIGDITDGIVKIEILEATDNLLEVVEKEAYRVAIKQAKTRTELAQILGVSVRTVRNKINKYFREGYAPN